MLRIYHQVVDVWQYSNPVHHWYCSVRCFEFAWIDLSVRFSLLILLINDQLQITSICFYTLVTVSTRKTSLISNSRIRQKSITLSSLSSSTPADHKTDFGHRSVSRRHIGFVPTYGLQYSYFCSFFYAPRHCHHLSISILPLYRVPAHWYLLKNVKLRLCQGVRTNWKRSKRRLENCCYPTQSETCRWVPHIMSSFFGKLKSNTVRPTIYGIVESHMLDSLTSPWASRSNAKTLSGQQKCGHNVASQRQNRSQCSSDNTPRAHARECWSSTHWWERQILGRRECKLGALLHETSANSVNQFGNTW